MKTGHLTDRQQQDSVFASESNPAAVQAHLATCPLCQQRVQQYRLLAQGISQLAQAPQDYSLADDVLKQLPLPVVNQRTRWYERLALAACVVLVMTLFGVYLVVPALTLFPSDTLVTVLAGAWIGGILLGLQWLENRLNRAQVIRQFFLSQGNATFRDSSGLIH